MGAALLCFVSVSGRGSEGGREEGRVCISIWTNGNVNAVPRLRSRGGLTFARAIGQKRASVPRMGHPGGWGVGVECWSSMPDGNRRHRASG